MLAGPPLLPSTDERGRTLYACGKKWYGAWRVGKVQNRKLNGDVSEVGNHGGPPNLHLWFGTIKSPMGDLCTDCSAKGASCDELIVTENPQIENVGSTALSRAYKLIYKFTD